MTGEATSQTPLGLKLIRRITSEGPISVADYVDACLQDPEHGYYRRQAAIGASADFITAPEISQVFGELIGLWCAVVWQQMGAPTAVRLIEIGPGRGTLMGDVLRAARLVPAFRTAVTVELIESNATLETVQRSRLQGEGVPIAWRRELVAGTGPAIVIANEFLDTLPVEQWIYRGNAWLKRCVGLDGAGALAFSDGAPEADAPVPPGLAAVEGDVFESRDRGFNELAATLARTGSPMAGLFVDYGHTEPGLGDSLQAVCGHRHVSPFGAPGEADLTAQVDFRSFEDALHRRSLVTDGPLPQGEFLGRLGAIERASRLMAGNPGIAGEIEAGVARLMAPSGMGGRFQILGIRSIDLQGLPPFSAVETGQRAP